MLLRGSNRFTAVLFASCLTVESICFICLLPKAAFKFLWTYRAVTDDSVNISIFSDRIPLTRSMSLCSLSSYPGYSLLLTRSHMVLNSLASCDMSAFHLSTSNATMS